MPSYRQKVETMRVLNIGSKRFTKVMVKDEPSFGGACHEYEIETIEVPTKIVGQISFQKGAIKEHGVNGCHQEDLLAIVIDRLESFQKGDFRCRENAIALTKIQEALMWLDSRTKTRQSIGIEGTNVNHE